MISNSEAQLLLSTKPDRRIAVNGSITCVFVSSGGSAFGPFAKDDASPSHTAVADMRIAVGGDIVAEADGKMYLTRHNDMDNVYSCSILRNGVLTDVTDIDFEN